MRHRTHRATTSMYRFPANITRDKYRKSILDTARAAHASIPAYWSRSPDPWREPCLRLAQKRFITRASENAVLLWAVSRRLCQGRIPQRDRPAVVSTLKAMNQRWWLRAPPPQHAVLANPRALASPNQLGAPIAVPQAGFVERRPLITNWMRSLTACAMPPLKARDLIARNLTRDRCLRQPNTVLRGGARTAAEPAA